MTILCPNEFYDATRFAISADNGIKAAIASATDKKVKEDLTCKIGQATNTLLSCFGLRAQSDYMDNANPYFPDGSEIKFPDGTIRTVHDIGRNELPIVETVIFQDIAPYSFFFREVYIDRNTRQTVDVFDRCWYIFKPGITSAEVNNLSQDELDNMVFSDKAIRVFRQERVNDELAANKNTVVLETMRRREGMCGGIIYHPDYNKDGTKCNYGTWSTHT